MLDLVLKIQGVTAVQKGSFAILPPRQYDIAKFMQGKGRLGSGEISKHLGIPPGQASVFMNVMCGNKVVSKIRKSNGDKWYYMYTLIVESFEKKVGGRGVKREAS